ncbi:MAG: sulfatase-like hydrolase/transferase, partial [bacterium]|nr:sulfatase-like hydrolase/transferase [bacterium]
MDRVAAEAVVFENAISPAPWTFPAMVSLMTGVAHYVDNPVWPYWTAPLPTMATLLGEAGYTTRGISGNHIL